MMASKKENERLKLIQEKCQNLIVQMLKDEDNKYCVDCDAKGPRWASWNLGVFLCIRCAGIHRNLGVHITRVKSVNLDTWTPEQVVSLQQMGNSRARAIYEAQLPDGFRRPQTDAALESFIRAKYEHKKYVAKEWVPSPPPKADWDREIEEELEKLKRKKKSISTSGTTIGPLASPNSGSSSSGGNGSGDKKGTVSKPTPIPAPLPKPKTNANSPKTGRISTSSTSSDKANTSNGSSSNGGNTHDLLGLTSPTTASHSANGAADKANDSDNDEFNNFFGSLSISNAPATAASGNGEKNGHASEGQTAPVSSLAKEEADFFNQTVPTDAEKAKLTKDSIMALYGSQPTTAAAAGSVNLLGNLGNGGFAMGQQQQQPPQPGYVTQTTGPMSHFQGMTIGPTPAAVGTGMPQFGGYMQHGQPPQQPGMFMPGALNWGGAQGFASAGGINMNKGAAAAAVPQHQNMFQQPPHHMAGPQNQFPMPSPHQFNNGSGAPTNGMMPILGGAGGQFMTLNNATTNTNNNNVQGGPTMASANSMQQQFGNLNLGNVWQ